ncbi:cytochrome b, partial [Sphingomonas bacterium]|uniref:cytochrome b n=1 Tax=Sphingomonas bacterium TaxID=1895847 RepID=UPI0015754987
AIAAAQQAARHEPPRATGGPPIWFLFTLPLIKPINEIGRYPAGMAEQGALHGRIERVHFLGGWALLLLFGLHVAGALKHQLIDRHRELARMGIGRIRPRASA